MIAEHIRLAGQQQIAHLQGDYEREKTISVETEKAGEARQAARQTIRTSERERYFIKSYYEINVKGNLEAALQTCELWAQTYPREALPNGFLAAMIYPVFGKY
jgi:hypothetical protein